MGSPAAYVVVPIRIDDEWWSSNVGFSVATMYLEVVLIALYR